jgi:hypothetical protein
MLKFHSHKKINFYGTSKLPTILKMFSNLVLPDIHPQTEALHPEPDGGGGPLPERPLGIFTSRTDRSSSRIGPAESASGRGSKSASPKRLRCSGSFCRGNRSQTLFRGRRRQRRGKVAPGIASFDFSENFLESFWRPAKNGHVNFNYHIY